MLGIDVRFGHHTPELTARPLQNIANAYSGAKYVGELYGKGIEPKDVVYLVFYTAQRKLIRDAFAVAEGPFLGKALTVDIFQGQEGSVVILDTVVG